MVEYQWNIFWAKLDPVKGSEQAEIRPIVVVSAEEVNKVLPILGIIPLTSMKSGRKIYPTEVLLSADDTGLDRDSIAMAHQIRILSKERILNACGKITSDEMKNKIRSSIKTFLDLL
ncbi:MAG: type II toxin-antitoxin system PemK/MazF family toxin [Actinobacteria bacterium]|nr:type II toxin-antitoxin system PemK/MazF family toxin [Actinomycetota bacterium]